MNEWKRTTLGNVCKIKYGKDHKKLGDGDIPVYGSGGIMRYVDTMIHNKKSVLIPRKGTLGNLFLAKPPFWTVDTIFWTDVNTDIIETDFLYYLLKTKNLSEMNVGTAVPSLTTAVLNELELNIPSLEIQQKIAKILSAIDDKIELNNKINDNLEQQAQAIFKSWFIDFEPFGGVMPSDWEIGTFFEITEKTLSGDWGKDCATGNYIKHTFCIRGADIPNIKIGKKGKMPTRYILEKNFDNKQLTKGDLVVEISGGSPTQSTGRVAAVSKGLLEYFNEEIICTNFCRALTPKLGYSMFMYYYWQYLYDSKTFFSYENGTTGIKNLDINGFLETEIINIPLLSKAQEFDTICQTIHKKIYCNGNEIEKLAQLRDTLLSCLMSGEIDVSQITLSQLR